MNGTNPDHWLCLNLYRHPTSELQRNAADRITALNDEIERLRAAQFRWIPVSERKPMKDDRILILSNGQVYSTAWFDHYPTDRMSAWAPIPPMPEPPAKTQEEKDEEAWMAWAGKWGNFPQDGRGAFRAGLKAAREAKP